MSRFKKENLRHIQAIFEEKTGADLNPAHRYHPRRTVRTTLVFAAVLIFATLMLGFTGRLFTPLDDDELTLSGSYEGNGIVSIYVENGSDKNLTFQKKTKLMRWVGSEEVETLGGKVIFENTEFPAHSSGTMTLDISKAYDVKALEESDTSGEWFYFVLTNNDFLFGHDWMCSVTFGTKKETAPEEPPVYTGDATAANIEEIEEELRFYFEETYNEVMALNGANFQYQQKVQEVLARFDGTIVPALSPTIMVGGPSEFLDPEPKMDKPPADMIFDESIPAEQQYLLTWSDWTYTDAYGRMVATVNEKAWSQVAVLPQRKGETDGGVTLPLIFLFVYDAEMVTDENYAFIYGQLRSFADLEDYKVLSDEHYTLYDFTDLIYNDVDAYLDYFLTTRTDVYCDDQIRQRVHNIYDFYRNKDNIRNMYGYFEW